MAKRIINEGILVVRDGKRIQPQIGKAFDLTKEEIAQLEKSRPQAISKLGETEEDPRSTSVEDDGTADDLSALTKAELVARAEALGLSVASNANKADIIAAIQAEGEGL